MTKVQLAIVTVILGLLVFINPRMFAGRPLHRLAACAAVVVCGVIYIVSSRRTGP
jgi:hypothetical protein